MLIPEVAEWLELHLTVTPETPYAELRAISAGLAKLYRAMDPTLQDLAIRVLSEMGKTGTKRVY